jgi:hypothetical protein
VRRARNALAVPVPFACEAAQPPKPLTKMYITLQRKDPRKNHSIFPCRNSEEFSDALIEEREWPIWFERATAL